MLAGRPPFLFGTRVFDFVPARPRVSDSAFGLRRQACRPRSLSGETSGLQARRLRHYGPDLCDTQYPFWWKTSLAR